MGEARGMLALLRVRHWVKNLLVLFPVVFGGALLSAPGQTAAALLGFCAFCLASSGVYVVNDLRDVERDRQHPEKRKRPLASGAVRPQAACVLAAVLFAGAAALSWVAAPGNGLALACLAVYVGINLAYSAGLKNVPIVDIVILASGYLLRVLYGSLVTGIDISMWLYLTVVALSFYLGMGKRRNESVRVGSQARAVLTRYPTEFLSANMTVFFALGLVFYSLWATDAATIARAGQGFAVTIPLVLVICMRYSFLISQDSSGDPVEVMFGDWPLLALVALFAVVTVAIIYVF